ncbi:uncharacterized protein LOC119463901 [Dermacentor silvarum]|uniref:uncharacterized protein LOC119463901 n=1 Tax=Dermacentor silvarum TaxID=543639 RepID=UPI00189999B6|nr:uncharacterized protein LOC119463901 [Dermacentor silvarum]
MSQMSEMSTAEQSSAFGSGNKEEAVKRTTVTEMSKTVSASVEEMTSEPPMVTGSTPEPTSPMSSTTPPPPKKYVYCVTGDRLTNDHALTSGFCDVAIYSGFVRIRNELKPGLGSYSWQVFRQAIKKGNFTAGISIVVPWPDGPKTVTEHFDKLEQSLMDLNKNENIMAFGFLDIDYEIMNITGTIKDAYKLRNHSATMANAFLQPPAHFEHGDNPQQAWEDWKEAHTIYEQAFEYATKPAATKKKPPVFSVRTAAASARHFPAPPKADCVQPMDQVTYAY